MKSNANCDIIEVLIIVHTVTGITYKKKRRKHRMSIGTGTHRRRRRLTKAERKKLIVLGSAAAAVIVFAVLSIITAVMVHRRTLAYQITEISNDDILKANFTNADKLMIVAHPDDESIWGGGHLSEGGYLVVCITNGRNEERRNEFLKAVKASGNAPLILDYPDKVNGKRDDWGEVNDHIQNDVGLLTGYKKWKQIVTHNPEGEYGHIHHRMLNVIVTNSCEENGMADKLWYFGEYYTKSKLPDVKADLPEISAEALELKNTLMECYKSQSKCVDRFRHMAPYENWKKYK